VGWPKGKPRRLPPFDVVQAAGAGVCRTSSAPQPPPIENRVNGDVLMRHSDGRVTEVHPGSVQLMQAQGWAPLWH
jgi:hypothetical protein